MVVFRVKVMFAFVYNFCFCLQFQSSILKFIHGKSYCKRPNRGCYSMTSYSNSHLNNSFYTFNSFHYFIVMNWVNFKVECRTMCC